MEGLHAYYVLMTLGAGLDATGGRRSTKNWLVTHGQTGP